MWKLGEGFMLFLCVMQPLNLIPEREPFSGCDLLCFDE
jgi:hypothetical protein